MSTDRPTPEDFLELIRRQKRGRLKLYLGSSAGVGKTWAMLREGHRLRQQGVDVAIGYVEPHDRPETRAQIGDLETVPPRQIEHRGLPLLEMDLEAVLRRRPTVALVDELAHTNAPGGKNAKRWQDVQALRDAGIHVISTLNIQHLESLYDVVEKNTGVRVTERIPDQVVADADQIIHVDLEADDLIERLKAGKIYPTERVPAALENFFTVQNLTRLREITLNETARFLDRRQRREQPNENKPLVLGKVMAALSSRGPDPEALLRKTARLAEDMNAPWFAVYVRTKKESGSRLTSETHRLLSQTLDLAQNMGGSIVLLENNDVADALAGFARSNQITHLVLGRPRSEWKWPPWKKSLVTQLLNQLPAVDLIID